MRESIALADGCKVGGRLGRGDARGGSVIPGGSSFKQPRRLLYFLFQIRFGRGTHVFRTRVCCDTSISAASVSIEDRSCSNRGGGGGEGIVYRFSQCQRKVEKRGCLKTRTRTRTTIEEMGSPRRLLLRKRGLTTRLFLLQPRNGLI